MQAVILSIGDELALGQTVDTNSAYLAAKLAELGIWTRYHETLADDQDLTADALLRASQAGDVVLVTGGLGPTKDDLTRQVLAQAMGVELREDPDSLEAIRTFFAKLGREMSDSNRVQALLPTGADMIPNANGTAPGIHARLNNTDVFVMPGVPREMRGMYDATIRPFLSQRMAGGMTILTTKVNTFGMGESNVGQLIADLMERGSNPTVGTTVAGGIVSVRIRSVFADPDEARQKRDAMIQTVSDRLGPIVFGRDEQTLASTLIDEMRMDKKMIATAESCTGGLIGKMLTDISGSSDVYAGGWVTYTNGMKQSQLGVPTEVLQNHGAVSGQTVCAMAQGALQRSGADLAISVSGVAGPTGGTEDKPVGTVWIGLASRDQSNNITSRAALGRFPGSREQVRTRAAMCALQLARLQLASEPLTNITWITDTYPSD